MPDIVPALPDLSSGNRARDAQGILADVEKLIAAVTTDWTDRSNSDPGVVILQVVSYLLDHTHWQVDRALTDALLTRTTRRSPAVAIARALGYEVDGPVAATVSVRFTLTGGALVGNLTIPRGTEVQGSHEGSTVRFMTDADLVILAGFTTGSVAATEGRPGSETLGVSNGEPYQRFRLTSSTVIKNRTQNSLVVSVAGLAWTEVSSFAASKRTSREFVVLRDHLDRLTVVFGDDRRGAIPQNAQQITATYRTGGGAVGNVPAASITIVLSTVLFNGAPVALSVTNTTPGTGGQPRETLDSIKINAPATFASQGRAVTGADYGPHAPVSGVLRARAYRPGLHHVEVRVVPLGWQGEALAAALEATIVGVLDLRRIITDVATPLAALPVRPRITMEVVVAEGHQRGTVQGRVQTALSTLYALASLQFGEEDNSTALYLSDLIAAVDNTEGVDHVNLTEFTRVPLLLGRGAGGWDVTGGNATLGTVTVGATAVNETFTIEFNGSMTFVVTGSVSGRHAVQGSTGVVWSADDGRVSFTITAGANPMSAGSRGRFTVSRQIGNIPFGSREHPVYVATDLTIQLSGGVA